MKVVCFKNEIYEDILNDFTLMHDLKTAGSTPKKVDFINILMDNYLQVLAQVGTLFYLASAKSTLFTHHHCLALRYYLEYLTILYGNKALTYLPGIKQEKV